MNCLLYHSACINRWFSNALPGVRSNKTGIGTFALALISGVVDASSAVAQAAPLRPNQVTCPGGAYATGAYSARKGQAEGAGRPWVTCLVIIRMAAAQPEKWRERGRRPRLLAVRGSSSYPSLRGLPRSTLVPIMLPHDATTKSSRRWQWVAIRVRRAQGRLSR